MIGIQLQNVSFSYANQTIFNEIDCTFFAGEKICLLGENGSGKTTFLKILCSLLKPQSGKIRFFDSAFDLDNSSIRKKMGVQLDDNHLLRQFTVMENISLYQQLYLGKIDIDKISQWLDRFDLQTYRETQIQHLSQGEQKKVSLIKALIHEPDVIMLDEPTNSLDQDSKNELTTILQNMDSKSLIFVSTHDQTWTPSWSTKSIRIENGKLT